MNFWKPLGSFPTQGAALFSASCFLSCYHGQVTGLKHFLAGLSITEMHPDETPASCRANPRWAADTLLKGNTGRSPCNIWLMKAGGCSGRKPEGSLVCSGKILPQPQSSPGGAPEVWDRPSHHTVSSPGQELPQLFQPLEWGQRLPVSALQQPPQVFLLSFWFLGCPRHGMQPRRRPLPLVW